jgi:hypothetical protein
VEDAEDSFQLGLLVVEGGKAQGLSDKKVRSELPCLRRKISRNLQLEPYL